MEPAALLVLAREAAGAAWQEATAKEQCAPVLSLLSSGDMLVASMGRAAAVSPMTDDNAAAAEVVHCRPVLHAACQRHGAPYGDMPMFLQTGTDGACLPCSPALTWTLRRWTKCTWPW